MSSALVAGSIIDLCGAIGLGVAILTLLRRDARSPLTSRLAGLLGTVAVLFAVRGLAWSGGEVFERLALLPAASVPLAALIVTEGALRRHMPRPLKVIALFGAVGLGLGGCIGLAALGAAYFVALALFQVATIATCGFVLLRRDRASLTHAENVMVDRLALTAFVVLPFLLTDFRDLFPWLPVRLGALGTLFLLGIVLTTPSGPQKRSQQISLLALRIGAAAALGVAAAFIATPADSAQIMLYAAVAVAGVLAIGMMVDALRAVLDARAPGLLGTIAEQAAIGRDAVMAELAANPLLASAKRYREADLAAYDPDVMRSLLAARRIIRRADAPWSYGASDPMAERVMAMMAKAEASHLLVVSYAPIDIMALAIPVVSADPATETALALLARVLALSPEATA